MGIARVRNAVVWRQLRIVFIGSALLFLINIYFGFANALTVGDIPRSQILVHLHAGSVGWITLSAIGLGIWVVTGQRDVPAAYERTVRVVTWAAVIAFAGYIPNFWLAFLPGEGAVTLFLPIFGVAAVLVLWWAALFVLSQLRHQPMLTTVHLLADGALLVAAIGATVGALLGLERVIGQFLPLPQVDRAGAHAGMMDTYLFLVAAAGIEWIARPAAEQRWSWPGVVQAGAWTVGATLVPVAFFLNALEALLPVFGLLLLLGLALFLVRVAWRALLIGPFAEASRPWAFFATVWLIVFMGLFLAAVGAGDFTRLPAWFGTAFVHAGFVGMMTNLILGVHSLRAHATRDLLPWAEPAAAWVLNLGLLTFIGLKIVADVRTGAFVMGTGILLGVGTMIVRLWISGSRDEVPHQEPATAAGS